MRRCGQVRGFQKVLVRNFLIAPIFGPGEVPQGYPESAVVSPGEMIASADYDPSYDDDGDGDQPQLPVLLHLHGQASWKDAGGVLRRAAECNKTNYWGAPAYLFRPAINATTRPRCNRSEEGHNFVYFFP